MTGNGPHADDTTRESLAPPTEQAAPLVEQVNDSRRRFTTSGLAASGVLLTLASRSVMGQTAQTPSGFASGNNSVHCQQSITQGRSPGYWKNYPKMWPLPPTTKFSSVFACTPKSAYRNFTMMDLLTPQTADKNNLGMHLVAALLNARMGWTPFLTEERIRSMFSEWQNTGHFSPKVNTYWNNAQIVTYLKSTQL